MKFVIQRVSNASCTVEGNITGSIQKGFLVLIGISDQDTIQIADKMIKKLLGMRIFGADMKISLLNDGPFTIILDSAEIC